MLVGIGTCGGLGAGSVGACGVLRVNSLVVVRGCVVVEFVSWFGV